MRGNRGPGHSRDRLRRLAAGQATRVFTLGKKLRNLEDLTVEDDGWVVLDYPRATAGVRGGWWSQPDTGPGLGEITLEGPKGVLHLDLGT
jgi:hypothetical protein